MDTHDFCKFLSLTILLIIGCVCLMLPALLLGVK